MDAEVAFPVSYLTFDLGPETFAARVDVVREILDARLMKPTLNRRAEIAGTIDLPGRLLAVLDVGHRDRAGDPTAPASGACVIVLGVDGLDGYMVGMLADRVLDVVEIRLDAVEPVIDAPPGWSEAALLGVARLDGRCVHLLNLPRSVHLRGRARVLH
jgi:purine-binding chemotaxis protein CheW